MKDHFGRNINYLRLSITDRCNLRCKYCMPHGVAFTPHEQILTYEEFLRIAQVAVRLGITRFKVTGGEPLVRKGVTDFIAALKRLGVNVEKQLKVANLSSEFFKKNTSVATAKYQLQLGSSAEVAKVWQALDGLGISNVSILKVSHSKIDEYKEQVRVEAMQNAKQSAQTLAGAIGQNVGKCFYIYDSNNNVMPVLYDNMAVMRSAKAGYAEEAAADEPLDFKTIKLQYNVQAKFVLE